MLLVSGKDQQKMLLVSGYISSPAVPAIADAFSLLSMPTSLPRSLSLSFCLSLFFSRSLFFSCSHFHSLSILLSLPLALAPSGSRPCLTEGSCPV